MYDLNALNGFMPTMIRSSLSLARIKRLIGAVADFSGVNNLGLWCQRKIYGPHIRAIGYHAVQADEADMFEEQVRWYARHFVNVGIDELKDLIAGRSTNWERPGLILSLVMRNSTPISASTRGT